MKTKYIAKKGKGRYYFCKKCLTQLPAVTVFVHQGKHDYDQSSIALFCPKCHHTLQRETTVGKLAEKDLLKTLVELPPINLRYYVWAKTPQSNDTLPFTFYGVVHSGKIVSIHLTKDEAEFEKDNQQCIVEIDILYWIHGMLAQVNIFAEDKTQLLNSYLITELAGVYARIPRNEQEKIKLQNELEWTFLERFEGFFASVVELNGKEC